MTIEIAHTMPTPWGRRAFPASSRAGGLARRGGSSAPPLTLAQEFPGWRALYGDPFNPAALYVTESDRKRWVDVGDAQAFGGNDVWTHSTGIAAPWNGDSNAQPGSVTVDGHQCLACDGGNDSLTGWLTATATGENWILRSEDLSLSPWFSSGLTFSTGAVPPAGYTQSTRATSSAGSNRYILQNQAAGYYVSPQRFSGQFLARKQAGTGFIISRVDNHHDAWINLNTGTVTSIVGTGNLIDQTDGSVAVATTGGKDFYRITNVGNGFWLITYNWVANGAYNGNPFGVFVVDSDGVYSTASGNVVDFTGFKVAPARKLTAPSYQATAGTALLNGAFSACTFLIVGVSTSGGPRALVDISSESFATNTGPRCATDTGLFHTQGIKANGTDYNYSRALGGLDCHIVVGDPGVGTTIYRNGVQVATSTCTGWSKPSIGIRVARLFQDVWHFAGTICTIGIRAQAENAAWALDVSDRLRSTDAFPSITA